MQGVSQRLLVLLARLAPTCHLPAAEPVADMHLHYKWSQQDITSPEGAIAVLAQENIVMGVVIGTPAELALQLQRLAARKIVSLFGPYRDSGDWYHWSFDPAVVERARAALASGAYHGIGELHRIGGFAPRLEKAQVLRLLLQLAAEYDVPVMLHTEFSRPDLLLALCHAHPDTRYSGPTPARSWSRCRSQRCLMPATMSGRGSRRAIPGARQQPDQRRRRPSCCQSGGRCCCATRSASCWALTRCGRWSSWIAGMSPDTGWRELGRYWAFHRGWLRELPAAVARRIGCDNALAFSGRGEQLRCIAESVP